MKGFRITVRGKQFDSDSNRIRTLELEDVAGEMGDSVSLVIDDDGVEIPPEGEKLIVELSDESGNFEDYGVYIVRQRECDGETLTVEADSFDVFSDLKTVRNISYDETSYYAVMQKVAARNSMKLYAYSEFKNYESDNFIFQGFQSDGAFVRRVCEQTGSYCVFVDGRLCILKKGSGRYVSGSEIETEYVSASSVRGKYSWKDGARERYGSVKAAWRDPETNVRDYVQSGDSKPEKYIPYVYRSRKDAERAVKYELNKARKSELMRISLKDINPYVRAETPVMLDGFKPEIDGKWICERVRHISEGKDLYSELEMSRYI